MKIFVVGATGKTGLELLHIAVMEGHEVTAFVRTPSKIKMADDRLKVVKGDIFSSDSIEQHLHGHDAVISCLGFPKKPKPVTGYTQSAKVLIHAMKMCGIKRFVTMTAWWADTAEADRKGSHFVKWVVVPMIRPILEDMKTMENYLKEVPDVNYTVVRPPVLTNGSRSNKPRKVQIDSYMVGDKMSAYTTHRADVADFMLSCLNSPQYDRKMVAIV